MSTNATTGTTTGPMSAPRGEPPARTDLALSRRLEGAEAQANIAFVEARALVRPDSGATWCEVAGTRAMFDGVGSPITQTFGLGLFAPAADSDLASIERFFGERGSAVYHEVSPIADAALLTMLPARGYRPIELSSVLWLPLGAHPVPAAAATPRTWRITPGEESLWAKTAAAGWSDTPGIEEFMLDFGAVTSRAHGVHCFLAGIEGEIVGAAAFAQHEGVALLAGASTRPEWRRRGVQGALLDARLRYAVEQGCDLAMVVAQPGSTSQLNAERHGFRIAYTRIKWERPHAGQADVRPVTSPAIGAT